MSSSPRQSSEQAPQLPTKRRRTARACVPCRQKKAKCDGQQPSCTPCMDLKHQCSYLMDNSSLGVNDVVVSKSYLAKLEARLKALEHATLLGAPAESHGHLGGAVDHELSNGLSSTPPSRTFAGFGSAVRSGNTGQHQSHGLTFHPSSTGNGQDVGVFDDPSQRDRATSTFSHRGPSLAQDPPSSSIFTRPSLPSPQTTFPAGTQDPVLETATPFAPSTDGMGILPALNVYPSHSDIGGQSTAAHVSPNNEFYGETSGITFHSLLLDTILPGYRCISSSFEDPWGTISSQGGEATGFLGLGPRGVNVGEFFARRGDLPTREEAREMWEYFAIRTNKLYPFLEMESLKQSYEALLVDSDRDRFQGYSSRSTVRHDCLTMPGNQPLLALHFSIFALVQNLANTDLAGKEVHRVALHLLRKHLDWPHSLLKVQVLLIGTLLMQGVDCPSHGWDVLGYAVRAAYAIGLHDPNSHSKLPLMEREARSRAWWGCFTLDRLLTVSLGRPSSITAGVSGMPFPCRMENEDPLAVGFFIESIRLYSCLSGLIADPPTLSSIRKATTASIQSTAAAIAKVEREYAAWSDSVTPALRVSERNGFTEPLAIILALRGCTVRLLLHRPIVLAAIRQQRGLQSRAATPTRGDCGGKQLAMDLQQRDVAFGISLAAVIETGVMTVRLLKEASVNEELSAPWYQLFFAMNSFMSLVATFLLDLSQWISFIKTPTADILSSIYSAKDVVQTIAARYNKDNAKRALWIMERLLQVAVLPSNFPSSKTSDHFQSDHQQSSSHMSNNDGGISYDTIPDDESSRVNMTSFVSREHLGTGGLGNLGLQDLPHLDFAALYEDLEMGAPGMADWNLFDSNQQVDVGSMAWQPSG